MLVGMFISVNPVQLVNAELPILVTLSGIITSVNPVQLPNV